MGAAIYLVKNGMSGVISDDVLDEAKRQHAVGIIKTDLMEVIEPIFAFTHLTKEASTVALDRICERYQIAYVDEAAVNEDVVVQGEVFKDQRVVKKRTYYLGGKGLERFASDYRLFSNRLDIKIDMEARKTSILNLLIQVENDGADGGHFRWQPLAKVTKIKLRSGHSIPIRGFTLTVVAPWVGHVEKLAMEYIQREDDFIQYIAKKG
jgi:hypothetical protein